MSKHLTHYYSICVSVMDVKVDTNNRITPRDQLLFYKSDKKIRWLIAALVLIVLTLLLIVSGLFVLYADLRNDLKQIEKVGNLYGIHPPNSIKYSSHLTFFIEFTLQKFNQFSFILRTRLCAMRMYGCIECNIILFVPINSCKQMHADSSMFVY